VTWLRIPADSDSIVVNSQETKNFLSATYCFNIFFLASPKAVSTAHTTPLLTLSR